MPITEAQREQRRQHVGSSDAAAILGLSPYQTAHDIYLSKIHDLRELDETEPISIGNDYEEPLLRWGAAELGVEIEVNVHRVGEDGISAANFDALIIDRPEALEAKTTSIAKEWGEPETDQVPERVIVQAHHQMGVGDLERVWVPTLMARFDRLTRVMYKVEREDRLVEAVMESNRRFWEEHVLPRKPPTESAPSIEIVKRIRRVPDLMVEIDPVLVAEYDQAKQLAKQYGELADEAKARLLAAAGNATALDFGDPKKIYTCRTQTKTSVPGGPLKRDHPEIYKSYHRESDPFPVLRKVNRPKGA